jgi:hypothetical protein
MLGDRRLVREYSKKGESLKEAAQGTRYEPPQVRVLGSVRVLTQSSPPPKQFGGADGAVYDQQSVSWTS